MYAMDAVKIAASNNGVALYKIGRALGVADTLVNNTITRGSVPRADNLARMLGVCGYTLCAVPDDEIPDGALVIDDGDSDEGND